MSAATEQAFPYTLLVRLSGEIGTKARPTRHRFVDRLQAGLADALRCSGDDWRLRRTHDRLLVDCGRPDLAGDVARVFGVQSVAVARVRAGASLADVVEGGRELFSDRVRARRFAVRARRVGSREPGSFSSREVERELGAALLSDARGVDLEHPEVTVRVELFDGRAHFYEANVPGCGGLPLGTEGRAVALVSGGFDSAVAVWQLQKRGVAQDYVFCKLGGESHQLGALRVMKEIADRWSYGDRPRLHAIDFQEVARELQERCETRYWQVLLKRLMLRAAARIARERGALAIVTGEAVGQVSSQTLQNLAVISRASGLPLLRPLVGFNKDEIIALAERIGTAPLSAVVQEYCAMVPRRPATAASDEAIALEEAKLDLASLERAVGDRTVFDLRSLDVEAIGIPDLELDVVPDGATLIDLRSRTAFAAWHYPDAVHLDLARALAALPSFDRSRRYLLYCEFGLKSAHLAERMRAAGFEVHHFKGGLRALVRYARETRASDARLESPVPTSE